MGCRWWLCGGLEGDLVAEGFELTDVVAFLAFGSDAGVVVVGSEVGKTASSSDSRCQTMTRMERPTATTALFLPRRRAMRR